MTVSVAAVSVAMGLVQVPPAEGVVVVVVVGGTVVVVVGGGCVVVVVVVGEFAAQLTVSDVAVAGELFSPFTHVSITCVPTAMLKVPLGVPVDAPSASPMLRPTRASMAVTDEPTMIFLCFTVLHS